jgi:hypothetical protein
MEKERECGQKERLLLLLPLQRKHYLMAGKKAVLEEMMLH